MPLEAAPAPQGSHGGCLTFPDPYTCTPCQVPSAVYLSLPLCSVVSPQHPVQRSGCMRFSNPVTPISEWRNDSERECVDTAGSSGPRERAQTYPRSRELCSKAETETQAPVLRTSNLCQCGPRGSSRMDGPGIELFTECNIGDPGH